MAIQKDYKAIAGIIRQEYTQFNSTNEEDAEGKQIIEIIAINIANYFAGANQWFNQDTFISRCGITN